MWRLRLLASRVRGLFTGRARDRELQDEIDEHLRALAERFVRRGMSPADAADAASRQFGGVMQLRESQRDARGIPLLGDLARDLWWSVRLLRKRLAFSLITITILALAIGANTAIYSVAKAVIFAPLPFPQPDRLMLMFEGGADTRYEPGGENILSSVRNGVFQDWRERATAFERMAAVQKTQAILMADSRASVLDGLLVSDGFFDTLGVPALLGRHFLSDDYGTGGSRVAVIADRLWRAQYGE